LKPVFSRLAVVLGLELVALFFFSTVLAQARAIPVEAKRSKIAPYNTSYLVVENQLIRLLPGARIYSDQHRTITPSKVPPGVIARIRYNDNAEIRDVWILTPEEIARQDPDPESARRPGRIPIITPRPTPGSSPASEMSSMEIAPARSSP
jgi:hypothetical protein